MVTTSDNGINKVVIRVDASLQIGSGHVMRCLTLADRLRGNGCKVIFICRKLSGDYLDLIADRGFQVHALSQPVESEIPLDWNSHAKWLECPWQMDAEETLSLIRRQGKVELLIIDHYALDYRWQREFRSITEHIMVIDDLVESRQDCDLLLNQNFYSDLKDKYARLVPKDCEVLLGIKYALLRPEFSAARNSLRKRDGQVREILVSMGGSDTDNVTMKVLTAIVGLKRIDIRVNVVLGLANPHRDQIQSFCREHNQFDSLVQTDNIAELMASADLCVGAGGATSWERYCLGLPTLLVTLAMNQQAGAAFQAQKGLVLLMGQGADLTVKEIQQHLERTIQSPETLLLISQKTMDIIDGQGCGRVVKELNSLS